MPDIPPILRFAKENNPNVRTLEGNNTLYNLHQVLPVAHENHFGVIAVNQRSKYIVQATCEAAWLEKSPVIMECAESELNYCNLPPERLSDLVHDEINRMIGKYGYYVPVVLHLDHVQKDLTLIDRAAVAGFSSCEADLSKKPLEENIALSAEVVKKMHVLGISVEVEEGEIGFASALKDLQNVENYYTKVEDAYKLVEATRPDAVAIFVGNGHGQYLEKPKIGYDRIREVDEAIREFGVQVVLHGGSGLLPEDFQKAIKAGAAKFNYATSVSDILFANLPKDFVEEMKSYAAGKSTDLRKVLGDYEAKIDALEPGIMEKAKAAMTEHIRFMMKSGFNSSGKAALFQ